MYNEQFACLEIFIFISSKQDRSTPIMDEVELLTKNLMIDKILNCFDTRYASRTSSTIIIDGFMINLLFVLTINLY